MLTTRQLGGKVHLTGSQDHDVSRVVLAAVGEVGPDIGAGCGCGAIKDAMAAKETAKAKRRQRAAGKQYGRGKQTKGVIASTNFVEAIDGGRTDEKIAAAAGTSRNALQPRHGLFSGPEGQGKGRGVNVDPGPFYACRRRFVGRGDD